MFLQSQQYTKVFLLLLLLILYQHLLIAVLNAGEIAQRQNNLGVSELYGSILHSINMGKKRKYKNTNETERKIVHKTQAVP